MPNDGDGDMRSRAQFLKAQMKLLSKKELADHRAAVKKLKKAAKKTAKAATRAKRAAMGGRRTRRTRRR